MGSRKKDKNNIGDAMVKLQKIKKEMEEAHSAETFVTQVLSVLFETESVVTSNAKKESILLSPPQTEAQKSVLYTDPFDISSTTFHAPSIILDMYENLSDSLPQQNSGPYPSTHLSFSSSERTLLNNASSSAKHAPLFLGDSVLTTDINCDVVCKNYLPASSQDLESFLNPKTITFYDLPRKPKKIAEASFSEVFIADGRVYKIAPLNEHYSRLAFLKEAAIMRLLGPEKGVCNLLEYFFIAGRYSNEYIAAWEAYPDPENVHPGTFPITAVYGCLVLEYCDFDFESYVFYSQSEIFSFLSSLSSTLVQLEEKYKFEHRDLHWGNVMVQNGKAKLIDFSISRIEVPASYLGVSCNEYSKNCSCLRVIYTDLNEIDWLFNGDSELDPQFGVYKKMKTEATAGWMEFSGKSNELWFEYILKKSIAKTESSKLQKQLKTKIVKQLRVLRTLLNKGYGLVGVIDWLSNNSGDE